MYASDKYLGICLSVKGKDDISEEHPPLTASVVHGAGVNILKAGVLVLVKEVILDVIRILLAVNVLDKYSSWGVFLRVFVIVTFED